MQPTIDASHALDAIAERIAIALDRFSAEQIWAVAKEIQVGVPTKFDAHGVAVGDWLAPSQTWSTPDKLTAALRARTKHARIVALPILASLDKEAAAGFFAEAMVHDVSDAYALSYTSALTRGIWARWAEIEPLVPKENFVRLWLAGRFAVASLTDGHLAAVPLEELERWVQTSTAYMGAAEAQRICRARPELGSLEDCAAFLERSVGERPFSSVQTGFIDYLSQLFGRNKYEPALPLLRRLGSLEALFAMNDATTLVPIADSLATVASGSALTWDPHHVTQELRNPIRAAFHLDPTCAFDRLGSYLAPEAVATEQGAKIANDILLIGEGLVVDHQGTKLASGDGLLLQSDPRFVDALRALADHPRLSKHVRSILHAMKVRVPLPETKRRTRKAAK